MIFDIKVREDKWLEKVYEKAMKDLGEFYGINWNQNRPSLTIVSDLETKYAMRGKDCPTWVIGWGGLGYGGVYILKHELVQKDRGEKYDKAQYESLIRHELAHCFTDIATDRNRHPVWLNEGISTYVSGQLEWKKKPEKFEGFLACFDSHDSAAYNEGGWVVKILIDKFGKQKLGELLTALKKHLDEPQFKETFEKIYGFELSYKKVSELFKSL